MNSDSECAKAKATTSVCVHAKCPYFVGQIEVLCAVLFQSQLNSTFRTSDSFFISPTFLNGQLCLRPENSFPTLSLSDLVTPIIVISRAEHVHYLRPTIPISTCQSVGRPFQSTSRDDICCPAVYSALASGPACRRWS